MNIFLNIVAVLVLLPACIIGFEVFLALVVRGRNYSIDKNLPGRVVILIPAHNEAAGIAEIIDSLTPQLRASDEILVIADNCTDDTASIAQSRGARVTQRFHESLRGKGYALDFGIQQLRQDPPDVVIIVDADCIVELDGIRKLAAYAMQTGRPVQGLYLMNAPEGSGPNLLLAEFAWTVKNLVRPLGLAKIGLPCPLMGSGMAFPWKIVSTCELASGEIVEDLKLGLDLMQRGHPPIFLPNVLITSQFASSNQAQLTQRTRWEHGHLGMIFSRFPSLMLSALRRADFPLMVMALDMAVPPLALLILLTLTVTVISLFFYIFSLSILPLILGIGSLSILGISISLAWYFWGAKRLPLRILLLVPFYILRKIPSYFGFMVSRERKWVRTERDN